MPPGDLAFHTIALSVVDPDFAKQQLNLMLREVYLHPSGQIPAYEWNFSDVNPPVHAWATLFFYRTEQALRGEGDLDFVKRAFAKLMLNFTWWVNRKDRFGKNVFEGGFLGLDNIGVFDRSSPLPTGGYLEQADGTAWMAMFCQNMMELSVELASYDDTYEDLCYKFVEHFLWIASAMNRPGPDSMWDEEDGFYYDILRLPDGSSQRLKVRSMVGLLPLCATTVVEEWQRQQVPHVLERMRTRVQHMPELLQSIHATGPGHFGVADRTVLALVNQERLRRILTRMLDENEFLSPYGIRALSRYHLEHPYVFQVHGEEYRVQYLPAESDTGMFGGNSNWRGPVWNARQYSDHPGPSSILPLLRRQFPDRVPHRLGENDEPLRGEPGHRPASDPHLPAGPRGPAARLWRDPEIPDRSSLDGSDPVLRILPRGQRGWARRQPPDRVDGPGGEADRPLRPREPGETPGGRQEGRFCGDPGNSPSEAKAHQEAVGRLGGSIRRSPRPPCPP